MVLMSALIVPQFYIARYCYQCYRFQSSAFRVLSMYATVPILRVGPVLGHAAGIHFERLHVF